MSIEDSIFGEGTPSKLRKNVCNARMLSGPSPQQRGAPLREVCNVRIHFHLSPPLFLVSGTASWLAVPEYLGTIEAEFG